MGSLDNKTAVITGGNSGIGLATALKLQSEGANVVIFGRNKETLAEAGALLGEGALIVQGDVTEPGDLKRLFAETQARFGSVDVLFANAGVVSMAPFADVTPELYDRLFNINVKGLFFTVQSALPLLNDGASIIFNASAVTQKGFPGMSVYAATKSAVRSLARSLSAELVHRGIRVNVVSPGPIETPIFGRMGLPQEAIEQMGEQFSEIVPLKRFGQASEIAGAVSFLASDASSFVVGVDLPVDGGLTSL
jgi:NAD(P)-dependent dehydrogenase (short-subunit alcohol dehydrogenase family)